MKLAKLVLVDNTGVDEFISKELSLLCGTVEIYHDHPKDEGEIVSRVHDADALFVSWNTRITGGIISQCPKLKYIGMCCSLYDESSANVDIAAARENGITVRGVMNYGDEGVAQYVISQLIRLALGSDGVYLCGEPIELSSLKLGIVGMGALGRLVGRTAEFFDMEVSYSSRTIKPELPYKYLELHDLLRESDVISLHLPRNVKALGEAEFQALGAGKTLINTGIGACFDIDAFDEWLLLPDNFAIFDSVSVDAAFRARFGGRKNVLMNERVCGFTKNARERLAGKVLENFKEFVEK